MSWSADHDERLCREIAVVNPFLATKKGTVARGAKWDEIAVNLNDIKEVYFKVDKRAVRDRYNHLSKELRAKNRREKKESGIETDMTDTEKALEEIIEIEDMAELEQKDNSDHKSKAEKEDRDNAEAIRAKAMEGLTKKRKPKVDDNEVEEIKPKKRRSNGNEALAYLREKKGAEQELRKEELELKWKQLEVEEKKHDDMLKIMLNQQEQQQKQQRDFQSEMATQARQQNELLLALIAKN
jgi:hypothetical protein